MPSLDLGRVHVQIGNDAPHVCELPRLHLELLPDRIRIPEDLPIVLRHEIDIIFL